MSLRTETAQLRERLGRLAGDADADLLRRYALRPLPTERPNLYRRARKAFGRLLRRWGLRPPAPLEPWLAGLNHAGSGDEAKALVIWALGCERDVLRAACLGIETRLVSLSGFAPVLVTDVADFAFFSRLGWLVEFVPALSVPGDHYAARKERYLAWRYRDAVVLPAAAGLGEDVSLEGLLDG